MNIYFLLINIYIDMVFQVQEENWLYYQKIRGKLLW